MEKTRRRPQRAARLAQNRKRRIIKRRRSRSVSNERPLGVGGKRRVFLGLRHAIRIFANDGDDARRVVRRVFDRRFENRSPRRRPFRLPVNDFRVFWSRNVRLRSGRPVADPRRRRGGLVLS